MTDEQVCELAARRRRKALSILMVFTAAAVYLDKDLRRKFLAVLPLARS